MPSIESKVAETKARHVRERDAFESRFTDERAKLKADADKELRTRTKDKLDKSRDPGLAGQRLPSIVEIEKDVKRKLEEALADVDRRRADERKPLDARHKAEVAAASKGSSSKSSSTAQQPGPDDPVHPLWRKLSSGQRQRWHDIKAKYGERRQALDAEQAHKQERLVPRYGKSYSHGHDENAHAQLNGKEHGELTRLAATLQKELESDAHRTHAQAVERGQLGAKHAAANQKAAR
jgi:hypothetical protein